VEFLCRFDDTAESIIVIRVVVNGRLIAFRRARCWRGD